MKRLLLLLALCLIVGSVSATTWTFQSISDMDHFAAYGGSPEYITSSTGGNQYYIASAGDGVKTKFGSPFVYAAWTNFGASVWGNRIRLGDISDNELAHFDFPSGASKVGQRVEVSVVGGIAYYYYGGTLYGYSTPLSQNPSYISWFPISPYMNAASFDDMVIGSTDSKYVVGMPTENAYYIKKDMVNPASSGLFNSTTGTLVNSNTMYTTWGRTNISYAGNESIYLVNVDTQTVYETHYTGTASAGTTAWDIGTSLIANGAPYGRYQVKFGDFYSDEIAYIANGANIAFDKDEYSQQDQATITYLIDGEYWDTSTYTYSMKIYEGNTWNVVDTQAVSASSGTFTYTFTDSNPQGEYYAVIGTTPNAGGDFIWMRYDYAALEAYVKFLGYVNTAQNATAISGANVSFTQNGLVSNSFSGIDGNYTADGFLTGAVLTINVTAPGYSQYLVTLTPMAAKSISLNITLNSTTPTHTGLGIGGIARAGLFDGTTITKGYGEPISGATVMMVNTSNGESYTKTTNNAGWYLCDEGSSCLLTTKRPYDVWGSRFGYSNSPNYTAVAA